MTEKLTILIMDDGSFLVKNPKTKISAVGKHIKDAQQTINTVIRGYYRKKKTITTYGGVLNVKTGKFRKHPSPFNVPKKIIKNKRV